MIGGLEEQLWDLSLLASKLESENPQIRKYSALSLMKLNAIQQIQKIKDSLKKEKNIEVINILNLCIKKMNE